MIVGVELLDAIATTRAIRRYRPDPIPDDDLATILWAASRAPTGSNRQPYRMLVLRGGPRATEARAILGRAARTAWSTKRATDGYGEGSGVQADAPKARMARAMDHFVDHFEEIPVIVLACLIRYRAPTPTEGASVYPAVQNLLLAARDLGYGGAISMWQSMCEPELRAALGIPEGVALCATVTLGRPMGRHGPVRRRPLAELVLEDGWDQPAPWAVDPDGTQFTQAGPPRRR
jgi:nitroreductase